MRSTLHRFLLCSAAVVGCDTTSPDDNSDACQQTYEFGNSGCAEVHGLVVDPSGRPLPGAAVGVRGPVQPEHDATLVPGYVQTDARGEYRIRTTRFGPLVDAATDTVTVWVRAGVAPSLDLPIGTPGPMDSVAVRLEFSPVGALPRSTSAPVIAVPLPGGA